MDDMTAFERQLSGEIAGLMGPARPVDDLAVYESVIAARRQHRWGFTMFSALKFATASVILALFGGFLMMGVFTMQQDEEVPLPAVSSSPTTETTAEPTEAQTTSVRTDILPGVALTVEEVEPGVFHVLNDGVQDLILGGNTDVVAGHDDAIWLLRKNRFFRLGSEAGQAWPEAGRAYPSHFEVTPDGVVWVISTPGNPWERGTLLSSDGDGWTLVRSRAASMEVAHDGTLWASWEDDGPEVAHLGPDGWQSLDAPPTDGHGGSLVASRLYPTDSGDLYAMVCGWVCWVSRYEDGAWPGLERQGRLFDVAPDGTVWLLDSTDGLMRRLAGDGWASWSPDELPDMSLGIGLEGILGSAGSTSTFMAAPDSSIWASLWQRGPDGDKPPAGGMGTIRQGDPSRYDPQCDGLVRFDGKSADRFLPGRCVTMDIAADGSVWVLADEDKGKDLYVITPDAVAATG